MQKQYRAWRLPARLPRLLALAAFLACLAAPAPLRAQDDGVAVPDVTRGSVREARRELRGARLELGRVDSADSRLPAGTVVAQDPPAGSRARARSRVDVTVSRPRRLTVRQILFPLLSSGADPCSCAPPGAPLRPGLSVGPALVRHDFVRVPDLSGDTRRRAERELAAVDLVRGAVDSAASTRPAGTVVGQDPAPGTLVRRGTPVRMTLARRPSARVPDLAGDTLRTAEPGRAGADPIPGSTGPAGSVPPPRTAPIQKPTAPALVPPGTRVGVPPARRLPIPVPGLAARQPSAAGAPPAGSRPVTVPGVAGEMPAYPVIVLSPTAGESGGAGTGSRPAVPPQPVTVPDLAELTLAEARVRLEAAGLDVRTDPERAHDTWTVASQSPAAGRDAPAGTVVLLTLVPPSRPLGGRLPWLVAAGVLAAGGAAALWRKRRKERGASTAPATAGTAGDPASAKVLVGKLVAGPEVAPRAHAGLGGVLSGVAAPWKKLRKRRGGVSTAPVVTATAEWDPGSAKVAAAGELVSGPQVKLRAHADPGTQSVESGGPLVAVEVEE